MEKKEEEAESDALKAAADLEAKMNAKMADKDEETANTINNMFLGLMDTMLRKIESGNEKLLKRSVRSTLDALAAKKQRAKAFPLHRAPVRMAAHAPAAPRKSSRVIASRAKAEEEEEEKNEAQTFQNEQTHDDLLSSSLSEDRMDGC